mgnify:CR=1 FL=1
MSDNNAIFVNDKLSFREKEKSAIHFLENIVGENTVQLQLLQQKKKENTDLILMKQQERTMLQSSNTNNFELFSPNYSSAYNSNLDTEIKEIEKRQEELTREIEALKEKVSQLSNVSQCIEYLEEESGVCGNEEDAYKRKKDSGIGFLEAQETERQRIARDLHDSTVQNLTGLVHKTELCIKLMDIDPIRARLELVTMSNMIKSVINDMRDTIYDLRPMSLDDLGLVATVERYARQIMKDQELKVVINHNTEDKEILPVINLTLFRIINEACCNTIKHANATLIEINIDYQEKDITVSIKDNGIGFDLEKQKMKTSEQSSSFGLSIMKERTSLLSGTLKIHSENRKGTIVTVSVPITKCKGEKNE